MATLSAIPADDCRCRRHRSRDRRPGDDEQTIAAVGTLEEPLEWFDTRTLAAEIRRCAAAWAKAMDSISQRP